MWMKEGRLHIHLAHLEEAKPTEMPVRAHWQTPKITHRCNCEIHTHLHLDPQSLLFLPPSFFLTMFQMLVFRHLELGVSYRSPSSLSGLGAFLHVQSLSLIANLHCLSVLFYAQDFSFFPRLLSACCYFSTAHNKVLQRRVLLQG